MNILIISQYYFPEQFRITSICEALAARGHSVTVVAGIPNYPEGEIFLGYEESYKHVEILNGVKIIRCNNKPRHKGIKALALNYVTYVKCANKIIRKLPGSFDVVYVYQMSPVTMAIPAIKYAKKHEIPLIMYVLDLWPESMRDVSPNRQLSTRNPMFMILKYISKKIYNQSNLLLLKCDQFRDYLEDLGLKNTMKYEVLFEHAEESYLSVCEKANDNSVIDFMFLGNIGISSNCEIIVKATALLKDNNNFKVHFVGDGSNLNYIKEMVQELKLTNQVAFHGRCSQSEVLEFYESADVCLLTLSNTSAIGLTPPAKLPGYMAASRPILAAIDGAAKSIIEEANCGWVVGADDVAGLAALMQKVIDNPESLSNLGRNGRDYFLYNFTLNKHVTELEKIFEKLVRK